MKLQTAQFWPTLAAFLVMALTLSLGQWQLDRAGVKEARAEQFARLSREPPILIGARKVEGEQLHYRRVVVRGEWLTDYLVFLDNQVLKGQVGYFVYMPLRLEGGDMCILVNRGWVGAGNDRLRLPEIRTPGGSIEVGGTAQVPTANFKELGSAYREGKIWENLTVERFAAWSGLKLQPIVIWQTDNIGDGLTRDWISPSSGADRNRAYAFQWFALAGLTGLLWAYHFFKRKSADVE